jgi:phage terminase small subunit
MPAAKKPVAKKAPAKPKSVIGKPKSVKAKAKPVAVADKPLTPQQEAFCQEVVLNGGDKSAAYRKAYSSALKWKDNSVHNKASLLHSNAKVQQRIKELQAKVAQIAEKKFAVDAEYVLKRHYEMDVMDVADILDDDGGVLPVKKWPLVWRQSISGIDVSEIFGGSGNERSLLGLLKKIKWPDKVTNLKALGSHVSVKA